jgi:hypothetical protein
MGRRRVLALPACEKSKAGTLRLHCLVGGPFGSQREICLFRGKDNGCKDLKIALRAAPIREAASLRILEKQSHRTIKVPIQEKA